MKLIGSIFSIYLLCLQIGFASDFDRGIEAYHAGDYPSATEAFSAELEQNESAATRHNLALSLFKQEQMAESAWQLEQAVRLDPLNKTYLFKLGALREQLGLYEAPTTWWVSASAVFAANTWLIIASISFWLCIATLLFPAASGLRRTLTIKLLAWGSLTILLICVSAIAVQQTQHASGIVISGEPVSLHHAPASGAPEAGIARPGERAQITESYRAFHRIKTEAGIEGWISNNSFRTF